VPTEKKAPPTVIHLGFWDFTNGAGERVQVEVTVAENAAFQRSIAKMANRALKSKHKKAAALGGALQVAVVQEKVQ
jgi:sugar (pentulose or hexulose) kinase